MIEWELEPVRGVLAAMLGVLVLGSIGRLVALWRSPHHESASELRRSLGTWWVLFLLLLAAVWIGPVGVCILLMAASFLAFREFAALVATRPADRLATTLIHLMIPVAYGAVLFGRGGTILPFVPVAGLVLIVGAMVARGAPESYARSTGGLLLGVATLVYGLAHAGLVMAAPATSNEVAGGAGWFLFLLLLTELNDIAQALVGRRIGSRPITPRLSPHKTWEGFLGGGLITIAVAFALAPVLTPLLRRPLPGGEEIVLAAQLFWPALAGLVIVVAGFLGDLNMSGVKRDSGVKDSSTLLPGMGGVLDRVDSLTLTAPCFFWIIVWPAI